MYSVLIADDQIPDSKFSSEQEIRDEYTKRYDANFAAGFVFMHNLTRMLKNEGYEVDCANIPSQATDLAKRKQYDVIVLDLGWFTVDDLPYDDKMLLGRKIAEHIRANSSAPIIMFSSRFAEDEKLAESAAELGLLPFYKGYDDASAKHLLVAIRWAARNKSFDLGIIEQVKLYSFKIYRRLSNVLLGTIVCSVGLLVVSIALAAWRNDPGAYISSAFGVVSTFINAGIYKYVSQYRDQALAKTH
jgi:CheY-like chemotaxis protein